MPASPATLRKGRIMANAADIRRPRELAALNHKAFHLGEELVDTLFTTSDKDSLRRGLHAHLQVAIAELLTGFATAARDTLFIGDCDSSARQAEEAMVAASHDIARRLGVQIEAPEAPKAEKQGDTP